MKTLIFIFVIALCLLINFQSYSQLVSDFKVNNDTTTYTQNYSKIGVDAEGNFVIVWLDQRRSGYFDVYFQRFNMTGVKLGENTRINYTNLFCGGPEIAMKSNGNFFVCWYEYNGSIYRIKLKYFNKNGDSLSSTLNFIENQTKIVSYYSMKTSLDGNLIISWIEYTDLFANYQILYQRFDSTGNKIGGNVAATDTAGTKINSNLCIRDDGSFIICYDAPNIGGGMSSMAKLFDKNGNFISLTRVNDNASLWYHFSEPIVSADSLGRFCVAFNMYDFNVNTNGVLFQLFNKDGSKKGSNVNYGSSGFDQFGALVYKKKNGELLLSYEAGYRMFMKKADSSGNYIGSQFQVSNQGLSSSQNCTGFQIVNNKIFTTWSDNRYGNLDVFCNIRSYTNPDSIVSVNNISTSIPEDFKLYQNYPNPFNPETNIKFDVKKTGNISVKIFDITGRERARLVDGNLNAGSYIVKYNFSEFESGIYFYSLYFNGEKITAKKLMLLK